MAEPVRWKRRARRLALAAGVLALGALALDRLFPLPLPATDDGSAVVLARDGTPLRAFADRHGVWRYPVTAQDVSPLYLEALLGYEDRWFRWHPGVNPLALLRAAGSLLSRGRIVSGGSTLTMQVARIIEPIPHSFGGKLRQMLRALQLEAHLSKAEILALYLDRAPFGGTIEGVEAASWAYLGKSSRRLSHAEAALLAVLPQAPSRLRPDRHPEAAQAARDKVLARMAGLGTWSRAAVADARIERVAARALAAPLAAPLLAGRLHRAAPAAKRITSTLDAGLQHAAEARVDDYLARLPARSSVALLVVDNATLEARVYVGSGAFAARDRHGYLDMVAAPRSPGSTLKPLLYGLALDDGLIHSASLLMDAPQDFGGYRPGNFDAAFSGPVSATEALQRSLNVPAVALLERVGPERFMARLAAGGVELALPPGATPNLAVILGGTATRLEALVGAYSALANHGIAGRVRYTPETPALPRRLLSPGAAWIVRDMLATRPAGTEGAALAGSAQPGLALAWKTGTSYGYRDAWALGVMPHYTLGVWIGRPDGTPSPGAYGAVTALPLLFQIAALLPGRGTPFGAPPQSVTRADICWPLGGLATDTAPGLCRVRHGAWLLDGAVPPTFAERDAGSWSAGLLRLRVDGAGRRLSGGCHAAVERPLDLARWPALATAWLGQAERRATALPPLAPGCAADSLEHATPIRIAGLARGALLRRAPNGGPAPTVTLRALGADTAVDWLLDGRLVGHSARDGALRLTLATPGTHEITALTPAGAFDSLRVSVAR